MPSSATNKVKSITAFIVSNNINDEKEYTKFLKEKLKKYIPNYMIPKKFKFLEKLPMNNNGKAQQELTPLIFKRLLSISPSSILYPFNLT